jgi:O-antigen/teichoic acid export membrane protein
LIVLFVLPCVAGVAALGTVAAAVLLGPKWSDAASLISLIAVVGGVYAIVNSAHPALLAVGRPVVFAQITAVQVAVLIPALIVLTQRYGAWGAALAYVIAACAMLPISLWQIMKNLHIRTPEYIERVWRPMVASLVMYAIIRSVMPEVDPATIGTAAALVLIAKFVPFGALVYIATIGLLWLASGQPAGAESTVAREIGARWTRYSTR